MALVLGASVNGLSFVRSLARRGIATLLLDSQRLVGAYTRYGSIGLLPSIDEHPDAWVEYLEKIGSRLDRRVPIFATADPHVVFLAEYQEEIGRSFESLVPDRETVQRIVNKRLQYERAKAAGVLTPETHFPGSTDEAESIAGSLAYPCILKPYQAHLARKKIEKKVSVVRSPEDLVTEFERLQLGETEYMVQEIIPGGDADLFGYLAFWDATGAEHSWLTKQKLRQNPPLFGDGSLQITVAAPEVADISRRLLTSFRYAGFVGVEFKYDLRDDSYKLMEINPRTVSGNQLAISAGIDFPWIGYNYLMGNRDIALEASRSFRPGVKYVNEEWDLKAYLALRKSGELTFGGWMNSLRGAEARALWRWRDPGPAAAVLWRVVRSMLHRSFGTPRA